jgi:hypothetical protein
MIDETGRQTAAPGTSADPGTDPGTDPVTAFCQQCGRALTAHTRRQVGTGTFCEPCALARRAQAAGWQTVPPGTPPPGPGAPEAAGEPNPALAGFLGLIPGVGAMYNGQYAKAAIHLVVFVVLVSLADNLNWVIWWFVWGWIFYQAFEAYHTAQARRDGVPLPDPFGWNDLGDRLGYNRSASRPRYAPPPAAAPPAPPAEPGYAPSAYPPASYAQPVDFAAAAPPPPPSTPLSAIPYTSGSETPAASTAQFSTAPFTAPFTAPPNPTPVNAPYSAPFSAPFSPAAQPAYSPTYTGAAVPDPVPVGNASRFPLGAAWLIGLGLLFLLGNLVPAWHLDGRWLVPILLAAIALWMGLQRLVTQRAVASAGTAYPAAPLAGVLVGPVLLLTVAILLALQDAEWIPLRHSWPALLIVWGALLLLQRAQAAPVTPDFAVDPTPHVATGSPAAETTPR